MTQQSRTTNSIRNSVVGLIIFLINLILQFYSRKIFLEYLGTEILGLNTTLVNILQFLNLAELGIGTAVGFSLYKPLAISDYNSINDIISFQGYLYKRIGLFVLCGAIVLMVFFPLIFAKMDLPIWYAYATFGSLLFSALLGYFVNYKQILLSANQQEYKIQYSYKSIMLLKVLIQILCMKYLDQPYISWLVCEVVFAILASISLTYTTKKTFPFLERTQKEVRELRPLYSDIEIKIKQVFFHKISGFVLTQTAPLIIYMYINLTEVTLYGNYSIIVAGVISLMTAIFNGLVPGIGSFIISANTQEILKLFNQLFSFRFWFGSIMCFAVLILSQPFISLWIGFSYLLPFSTLTLMTCILFVNIIRLGAESFLNAKGMYSDIWAPIVEACLNLGLSLLLGYWWGLNGILVGTLISLILIPIIWKSYFLFKSGLNISYYYYLRNFFSHSLVTIVVGIISYWIIEFLTVPKDWSYFLLYAIEVIFIYGIFLSIAYFMLGFDMMSLLKKVIKNQRYKKHI